MKDNKLSKLTLALQASKRTKNKLRRWKLSALVNPPVAAVGWFPHYRKARP